MSVRENRRISREGLFRLASSYTGHGVWLLSIMHNIFIDGTRVRSAEAQRLKRAQISSGTKASAFFICPNKCIMNQILSIYIAVCEGPRIAT